MRVRLGEVLVQQGLIDEAQLDSALRHQKRHPGYRKLGETLLALQLVSEEQILRALSLALRVTAIDLRKVTQVDPAALQTLNVETAERELVLPLRFVKSGSNRRLQVAMADPTNLAAVDELQFRLGVTVEPCLSTISQVRDAIRRFYRGSTVDMQGVIEVDTDDSPPVNVSAGQDRTWIGASPDSQDDLEREIRQIELRFVGGPAQGKRISIDFGTEKVFGRGQDVDYCINDNRMSRRHFQVILRPDLAELVDLGSSNGTFLNKRQIGRAQLSDGDRIQAGESLLKVEFVES